jgi:hypothetical protein
MKTSLLSVRCNLLLVRFSYFFAYFCPCILWAEHNQEPQPRDFASYWSRYLYPSCYKCTRLFKSLDGNGKMIVSRSSRE